MGATATLHARLSPLERHLTAEVHASRRIRRIACDMERRDHLRDHRLAQALTRRRLSDLRGVRH
jgi:hypothetical protein